MYGPPIKGAKDTTHNNTKGYQSTNNGLHITISDLLNLAVDESP